MSLEPTSLGSGYVAEAAAAYGVPLTALQIIGHQLRSLVGAAREAGLPPQAFVQLAGDEIRSYLEAPLREGYATPQEGLAALLLAEGGCIGVVEACRLFRKPRPVTRQALHDQIRRGEVIAYRTGGGQFVLPVWQFRPEGGVIAGLPEVLAAIRTRIPGASELSPFSFFLQAHPVTGGRTPLSALRAGELETVLAAVEAEVG